MCHALGNVEVTDMVPSGFLVLTVRKFKTKTTRMKDLDFIEEVKG